MLDLTPEIFAQRPQLQLKPRVIIGRNRRLTKPNNVMYGGITALFVLSRNVRKAQVFVEIATKILASRGIRTVGELRALGTARRIQVIRNTYRLDEARDPQNFALVTNLANLQDVEDEQEMIDRIRAQMAFLSSWEDFKRHSGE